MMRMLFSGSSSSSSSRSELDWNDDVMPLDRLGERRTLLRRMWGESVRPNMLRSPPPRKPWPDISPMPPRRRPLIVGVKPMGMRPNGVPPAPIGVIFDAAYMDPNVAPPPRLADCGARPKLCVKLRCCGLENWSPPARGARNERTEGLTGASKWLWRGACSVERGDGSIREKGVRFVSEGGGKGMSRRTESGAGRASEGLAKRPRGCVKALRMGVDCSGDGMNSFVPSSVLGDLASATRGGIGTLVSKGARAVR